MTWFVVPTPTAATLSVTDGGVFPIRRVFCVGRNYADHAREMGSDPDREAPFFFTKPADAVTSAEQIPYPSATQRLEFEGELVVAIGKGGTDIAAKQALDHVYGYSVGCDLTRRDLQAEAKKTGRPWDMAKGFDLSAPTAKLTPASVIGHPSQGALTLAVNGVVKQQGDIDQMIWPVADVIAFLSRFVALAPGDLIFTGTPAGVGTIVKGDVIEITVAGVTSHRFALI